MSEPFSTHLLDRALIKERERREQRRKERLTAVLEALDRLSRQISFREAYIFGSLVRPYRFSENSDIDVAFVGLKDEDFFRTVALLSRMLESEVDVLQLESHRRRDEIVREGVQWKRND
ncbi:MAG: nucleotidyltransferase family protein [bacterium]